MITVPWLGLMAFTLAVLKLTGSISVSWWAVFSPVWVPMAFFGGVFVLAVIGSVVVAVVSK